MLRIKKNRLTLYSFCFFSLLLAAIFLLRFKVCFFSIDGREKMMITSRITWGEALYSKGILIDSKDRTSESLESRIKWFNGLYVHKAFAVKLFINDLPLFIKSSEETVEELLISEGIGFNIGSDIISPPPETAVKEGMEIRISRKESRTYESIQSIDYPVIIEIDNEIEPGKAVVVQDGELGEKRIIVSDEPAVDSSSSSEEILVSKPVPKIIAMNEKGSTLKINSSAPSSVSAAPSGFKYNMILQVKATAYTNGKIETGKVPGDPGYGITTTGTVAHRNPSGYSTVAVDPDYIPLGSTMYVVGYGYAVAEDTGSAIRGHIIDIFFDTRQEALNWGIRQTTIYILK